MKNLENKYWESLKGVKNEKAPNWKENPAHITTVHKWMDVNYGQPRKCEFCDTTESSRYAWANISGKYYRDKRDFLRLCTKCHLHFDDVYTKRYERFDGANPTPVTKLDKKGNIVRDYKSITEASNETGINLGNITACLRNYKYRNHAGGYKWRYKDEVIGQRI
jgi:hypothetical protein